MQLDLQSCTMASAKESEGSSLANSKYADLSGFLVPASDAGNPYEALIAASSNDPVRILTSSPAPTHEGYCRNKSKPVMRPTGARGTISREQSCSIRLLRALISTQFSTSSCTRTNILTSKILDTVLSSGLGQHRR